jgi:hypothetical protein
MSSKTTLLKAAGLGLVASASALTNYGSGNHSVPHVTLDQGAIQGFRDNHTNFVYLGIPYAATTGGENR